MNADHVFDQFHGALAVPAAGAHQDLDLQLG
jgi:hypothetical protein